MTTIRVNGQVYAVSDPYKAGHQLTEGEAQALNELRAKRVQQIVQQRAVTWIGLAVSVIVYDSDKNYKFVYRQTNSLADAEIRRVATEIIEQRFRDQELDPLDMEEMIQNEMENSKTRDEGIRRAQISQQVAQLLIAEL